MVLLNLRKFIKNHFFLFVLLMVTQILSVVLILLMFGIYQNNLYEEGKAKSSRQDIEIVLMDMTKEENGRFLDRIKTEFPTAASGMNNKLEYFWMVGLLYRKDHDFDFSSGINYSEGEEMHIIRAFAAIKDGKYISEGYHLQERVREGKWFSEETLNSDKKECIISYSMTPEQEGIIHIDGQSYEIIGIEGNVYSPEDVIEVTVNGFPESVELMVIGFHYNRQLLKSEFNKEVAYLREVFDGFDLQFDDYASVSLEQKATRKSMMLLSLLMGAVSAVVVCLIYLYIQKERRRNVAIYEIAGCTKKKAVVIYLSEMIIILTVNTLAGMLIFKTFVFGKICTVYEFSESVYNKGNILMLIGSFYILVLASMLIMIFFATNKSPKEMLRERS